MEQKELCESSIRNFKRRVGKFKCCTSCKFPFPSTFTPPSQSSRLPSHLPKMLMCNPKRGEGAVSPSAYVTFCYYFASPWLALAPVLQLLNSPLQLHCGVCCLFVLNQPLGEAPALHGQTAAVKHKHTQLKERMRGMRRGVCVGGISLIVVVCTLQ